MLSEKEIFELYKKYQNDFKCDLPELELKQEFMFDRNGMIKNFDNEHTVLVIDKDFNSGNKSRRYIESILYHEFTHIYDHANLFKKKTDFQEVTNFLFPYTEIHAIIIETKYILGLIYNPKKEINLSSNLYIENGNIKLKEHIQNIYDNFNAMISEIDVCNDDVIINVVTTIAYYIGISIFLDEYKLINPYPIEFPKEWNIDEEFNQIKTLYQNNEITESLCEEMNSLANEIANKIYYYYNDSDNS